MKECSMDSTSRWRLMFMGVLLAFTSIFQMGYANAYPNTAISTFRRFLNDSLSKNGEDTLTENGFNWMWSAILNVYFIGFAIGSWLAVPIADRIGRKWCLVTGNVGNFLSACLATLSVLVSLPWLFFVSRILFSLSAAVSMNSLILLLQESAPPSMRGLLSFNAEMAFVMMNLVGALAGMRFVLGSHIGLLIGLSCIPTFISVLIALKFHESPKYLALKKRDKEAAEKALYFYQRTNAEQAAAALLSIESESSSDDSLAVSPLSSPHTLFGLTLGVATLQLTSSIWPVLYYSTEFLTRANIDADTAELVSTFMLFVSSGSTVVGMAVVEKYPRKVLLLGSAAVNVMALLIFVVCEQVHHLVDAAKYGCIVAVVLHGLSYSLALGPIAWFITAELVQLPHRAFSQSLVLSVNQMIALLFCFVTLPLYDQMGSLIILFLFVIPGALCIVFLVIYLPETRGKTMDQIEAQMPQRFCCLHLRSKVEVDASNIRLEENLNSVQ